MRARNARIANVLGVDHFYDSVSRRPWSFLSLFLCTLINANTTVFSETFFRSPALDVSLSANCVYGCIVA